MRILLLESDLILAQALSEALREAGYDPIGPVTEVDDAITLATDTLRTVLSDKH